MDVPKETIAKTDPQGIYSVIVLSPPVTAYALKYNGSRQRIAEWKEAKAYQFAALTARTVFEGGEIGHLEQIFGAALARDAGTEQQNRFEGEPFVEPEVTDELSCVVTIRHASWCSLPATVNTVSVLPVDVERSVSSMQLLFAPAADLPLGWLTSGKTAKPIYWPFGEPYLVGGCRYCITLVQLPDMIVANMTPLGTV